MLKHIVLGLILVISPPLLATENEAKSELRKLLLNMNNFKADFTQQVIDADENTVHEASGQLFMTRPNKLRWQTMTPDETLLIADGEAVWNVDSFVEQVTVISQKQAVEGNPVILLTTEQDEVWSRFEVAKENTGAYKVVPLEKEGQIQALTLSFSGNLMTHLSMLDAQGQVSQLTFSDIDVASQLDPLLFVPNIPESYIVDDQR